jgi:anti-sigma B factor antagonist
MSYAPTRELELESREVGGATVVSIHGSVGMAATEKLSRHLDEIAAKRPSLVVLDLSDMDFICSQGLGALITFDHSSKEHGGQLRLVNPRPAIRSVFETTRLDQLFRVCATLEEALHC